MKIEKFDYLTIIKQLRRLCATGWIQRYDAVNESSELFFQKVLIKLLDTIPEYNNPAEPVYLLKNLIEIT